MGRHWPQFRGALLALAIALGLIDGCPIPPAKSVRPWQAPVVSVVRPIQGFLLKPFTWMTRWTRTHQRWALFQAVGRKQWRFEVQGRVTTPKGADWVTIYRANDPAFQEDADLLEYRKLRAVWNPTDAMSGYSKFGTWYMGRVLDRHPEFVGARLRIQKVKLDRGTVTDTGEYDHYQTRERSMVPRRWPPALPAMPGMPGHLPIPPRSPAGTGSTAATGATAPTAPTTPPPDAGPPPDAPSPAEFAPTGSPP